MKLILLSLVAIVAIVLAVMLYREVRVTRAYDAQRRRCIAYATASVPDVDPQAWCQP